MDAALAELRAEGFDVRDEDVARLSPLGHGAFERIGSLCPSRFPSSSHAANCVRCAVLESCLMTMPESSSRLSRERRWKNDAITRTPKLIGWKLKVAHEIKAAGIDLNQIVQTTAKGLVFRPSRSSACAELGSPVETPRRATLRLVGRTRSPRDLRKRCTCLFPTGQPPGSLLRYQYVDLGTFKNRYAPRSKLAGHPPPGRAAVAAPGL
jgi:hypothetical protein